MAIVALTKNYKAAMKKGSKLRQGWKKPPKGKVIVNVDTTFNEEEGCGSVGAIIRDFSGGALAAAHSFVPHFIDAPMAEVYALKEGLMLAQHIGCNRLIVQSDCMKVVQTMNNRGFSSQRLRQLHCMMNVILYGADFRIYPLSITVVR
jgi:hypothetical protein